jgi:hypothetical protein
MSSEGYVRPALEAPSPDKTEWQKPMVATLDTWEAEGNDSSGADGGLVS